MKLSTGWRADKTRKNRARATRKPKIRWEVLGLPNPLDTSLTTSMEDIRRQAGLGEAGPGAGQYVSPTLGEEVGSDPGHTDTLRTACRRVSARPGTCPPIPTS